MANELKGITVRIDADLHAEIKKYLEDNNMTMAEFITHAVDDELHPKYNAQEENKVEKMRTLAFQVPEDLFQRIKGYLGRTGMSQKNFVLGLIEEELDRDEEMRAAAQSTEAENAAEEFGEDNGPDESDGDIAAASPEAPETESYGQGSEDPIDMEGNSASETGEPDEMAYDDEKADDPAYTDDTEDEEEYGAPDLSDSDGEPDYDAGEADDFLFQDEGDDYDEDGEVDDEYDDEESEDEDFDAEEDSEDYDEDEDSEEYDEEDDSEEYGEGEYDDEDDEDEEEEEESQSFVMSM